MNIKSNKGLTLVEVIVTVAIMGIIIAPISLVFTTAYTNFNGESDKVAAQQGARDILYGKGIDSYGNRSYGIMGDLERSSAKANNITIEDIIEPNKGRSISMPGTIIDKTSLKEKAVTKKYSYIDGVLYYDNDTSNSNPVKYIDQKSSTNKAVIVSDFSAEKIDNKLITISVTVTCGDGEITLESSYRIPDIE